MPTTPPSLTPPGTAPSTADPANFDARADALLGWLPTMVVEMTAALANVYANAVDALNSAALALTRQQAAETARDAAAANAAAAAASAGASQWVSGTTYALGARVWSPANGFTYRRTVAGAGTTDPSLDPTNWSRVQPVPTLTAASFYL